VSKSVLLRGAALLFAALSPAALFAQFQQPTNDELKMTSDPKAPGAAAVYLDIEEIANDPLHYRSTYCRIKVLTEKGKELATVNLPYLKSAYKITDIKGRTIHPDGTVIPLTVKPEDLLTAKSGELQFGRKVFTLPGVEVGSILEYRYEIHYDDNEFSSPTWEIQRPYFVRKAHYQFTPFKAFMPTGTPNSDTSMYLEDEHGRVVNTLMWWNRLPGGVTVKTSMNGSYSVDVAEVPPAPDEEWMPPIDSFLYRVFFYYMAANSATEFWMNDGKLWSKDVDKFADPSKGIKAAVDGLVSLSDSEIDKAKKLYAAVQALDNTDYSRARGATEMKLLKLKVARHAEDTWKMKSGSSEDIAMLYLAMLRAAGLTAYAAKVVDRDRALFDPSYMSLDQLDTTLVVLSTGGKQMLLDPGEKMCAFGTVNWRHSFASGVGQSAQGLSITTTPEQDYRENMIRRTGEFTLDAHGGIAGNLTIEMTGQSALRWRQIGLRNDDAEVKKQFDHDMERIMPDGVEAHVDHFLAMDQPDQVLLAIVKVKGTVGTATAKRLLLPGFFFNTRGHQPFVSEEKRMEPVDMHYGDRVTDVITYHFPSGVTVEGAPPDQNISWPGHAVFITKSKADPTQVAIADSLAQAFTMIKPEEYQDLRGFYQKIEAADKGEVVLTNLPAAGPAEKGN